ncbi:conjugative transposon protein TraJ [Sphingobacterium detergens]|uniref:Conjugative transposon TraJ protein n=1 Tax=Sphingobacterium detergens TaxID=1145106 RepID=A0A420ARS7_SPHD1|nr:conjugative transposon protein TraJ [Sphingobacterium detergens]RKE47179.1 conjugative transposon TraJ protein [Sphingobacterium detergens]
MGKIRKAVLATVVGMVLPYFSQAQGAAERIKSLHTVLDTLYKDMMPMCEDLIGVGSGIACFAALFYIASRVWRQIANAEPIDFYPLFRPFVLGFCIMNFSSVIALINGVMQPTVSGTAAMVKNSDKAIAVLLQQKEEAIKNSLHWKMYVGENNNGDKERWLKYTHGLKETDAAPEEGFFESVGNDVAFAMDKVYYNFKNSIKTWMSEILKVLFEAAALCINTLRTFQLIVLAIIGPMVLGLAVFDGFQHTLTAWLAKYINIFLWLPVANIFGAIIGKIQENMLKIDNEQIVQAGDTFFSDTDIGYLIFMIIGIVGYFTVPSVANFVVNSGGGGALGQKITTLVFSSASMGAGRLGQGVNNLADFKQNMDKGLSGTESGSGGIGAIGRIAGRTGSFMNDKLSGKPDQGSNEKSV